LKSRLVEWEDPLAVLAVAAKGSGLEYLRAVILGKAPPPPMAVLMNLSIVEAEEGRALFAGTPGEEHYNPHGSVHGGWTSSLLDTALGCAVHSMLPAGIGYTTLELHANFIRPITRETGRLMCEAHVLHSGNRISTAEAKARDENGKLYAHATTTCLIVPRDLKR
jgi:uncharacterized protein (TIGR00369 family)